MDSGLEAGIHQGEVLVRERDVEEIGRVDLPQEGCGVGDIVGIDLGSFDFDTGVVFNISRDLFTLGEGPAGEPDFSKIGSILGALLGDDVSDAPGSDDHHCLFFAQVIGLIGDSF
jgi:hypothetical protein